MEELVDSEVRGHYQSVMKEGCSTFRCLTETKPRVCPAFESVSEFRGGLCKVIEQDRGLSGVAIPQVVLGLEVEVRERRVGLA